MTFLTYLDFYINASLGNLDRFSVFRKYGRNRNIDIGTPEDIWDVGGLWVPPTAARVHNITSTSANDAHAGTGLRTVRIEGLDASFNIQSEVVALLGLSIVPTVNAYTRIYRMEGLTAGSTEANEGVITATAVTDATITAQIPVGGSREQMAIYSVPAGKTGLLVDVSASLNAVGVQGASARASIEIKVRTGIDTATPVLSSYSFRRMQADGTMPIRNLQVPIIVPEKSDIIMHCTDVSENATDVSAELGLILADNEQ